MTGARVLVVDDYAPAIRVIALALERKGFVVESACDGAEALEMFERNSYDVLITDIDMPRMSGRDLCEALYRRRGGDPPFTVVITGGTDPEMRHWAEGRERTRFLEKPLSMSYLTQVLCDHFTGGSPA